MRIAHFCRHALVGETGVANAARGWAGALAEQGHHAVLVVDAGLVALHPPGGVEVRALAHLGKGAAQFPLRVRTALRGIDLLVVHGGWNPTHGVVGAVARRMGVPYVVVPHGAYSAAVRARGRWRKRAWFALAERRLLEGAVALHVLSEWERTDVAALGARRPTVVAPNGVTEPPIGWDGGSGGHLLYLGRYDVEGKGLDLLLGALARLAKGVRPPTRLHGPGEAGASALRALAKELGLGDEVHIGGPVHGDDKWQLLSRARALVLTSRSEAWPMSVAEALAAGVPVLATSFPMARWLAERGAAVCVPPEPDALAERLRQVAAEPQRDIAARGRRLAREELTWDRVSRSWLAQLAELGVRPGA